MPLTPAAAAIELGFQNMVPEPILMMKLLLLPALALLRALLTIQFPVPSNWIECGLPPPDWYLTFGLIVAAFAELFRLVWTGKGAPLDEGRRIIFSTLAEPSPNETAPAPLSIVVAFRAMFPDPAATVAKIPKFLTVRDPLECKNSHPECRC